MRSIVFCLIALFVCSVCQAQKINPKSFDVVGDLVTKWEHKGAEMAFAQTQYAIGKSDGYLECAQELRAALASITEPAQVKEVASNFVSQIQFDATQPAPKQAPSPPPQPAMQPQPVQYQYRQQVVQGCANGSCGTQTNWTYQAPVSYPQYGYTSYRGNNYGNAGWFENGRNRRESRRDNRRSGGGLFRGRFGGC